MIRALILTSVLICSQAAMASVPSANFNSGDPNLQSGKVMKESRQTRGAAGCGASADGTRAERMRSNGGQGETQMARARSARSEA